MNRTRKLMTCVTTSLLMAGGHSLVLPGGTASAGVLGQNADRGSKPDPKLQQAANDIREWLKDVPKDQAKTSDQIAQQFPALQAGQIQEALSQLTKARDLRTSGDGTKTDPYRYYGSFTSTGG